MKKAAAAKDGLNVGIIGCGSWGINYIRVCHELPHVNLVGISDVNSERLRSLRQQSSLIKIVKDVKSLIRSRQTEAIIVATPATTHHALTLEVLKAGKHVLVEKPITTNVGAARELVKLAQTNRRVLMVGHTFLFNVGILKVKSLMQSQEFGRAYYIHSTRTNLGPVRQDVNVTWDLATHDVAITNFLLDSQPEWVSAVGGRFLGNRNEDVSFITMGYPDDILANIHVSWLSPNKVREVVVVGNQQRIVFDDLNSIEPVRVFKRGLGTIKEPDSYGEFRLLVRDGDIYSPRVPSAEPLKNQVIHFAECVRKSRGHGHGRVKLMNLGRLSTRHSDGAFGLGVVSVLEAIEQSLKHNGSPVKVDR